MGKAASNVSKSTNAFMNWIDERLPVSDFWQNHMAGYFAPKNFNFWYYMGSLALLVLVVQILSGIFLTMHYKPDAELDQFVEGGAFAHPVDKALLVVDRQGGERGGAEGKKDQNDLTGAGCLPDRTIEIDRLALPPSKKRDERQATRLAEDIPTRHVDG